MEITVTGLAFAAIDIPEELVRSYDPGGSFEAIWCKNIAEEIMSRTDFDYIFHVENIMDAMKETLEHLQAEDRENE